MSRNQALQSRHRLTVSEAPSPPGAVWWVEQQCLYSRERRPAHHCRSPVPRVSIRWVVTLPVCSNARRTAFGTLLRQMHVGGTITDGIGLADHGRCAPTPTCPPAVPAAVQETSATSLPRRMASESNHGRFCQRAVRGSDKQWCYGMPVALIVCQMAAATAANKTRAATIEAHSSAPSSSR
jgi:hypothetical protein